jgi:hypothetical protein
MMLEKVAAEMAQDVEIKRDQIVEKWSQALWGRLKEWMDHQNFLILVRETRLKLKDPDGWRLRWGVWQQIRTGRWA